jgi:probable F420-dependent oxidoreductase
MIESHGSDPERWGVSIPVPYASLADRGAALRRLEELGYSGLWSAEANGEDAFVPLAIAAASTASLRLACGVIPMQTRGPALLAQTAATMCAAAPGRFALGIGASSPAVVTHWNARPLDRPLAMARDLIAFLRAAWAGDKITAKYETFSIEGFQLGIGVPAPPPLLVAALRPKMLALAGSAGDGAIVNWMSADDLSRVTPLVGPGKELVARVKVIPSGDWARVRAVAARLINAYFHVPTYRASQEWLGRGAALRPVWDAWAAGDRRAATDLVPDDVIDQLFLWGDGARVRRGLERFARAGASTTVPVIHGTADEVRSTLHELAPRKP